MGRHSRTTILGLVLAGVVLLAARGIYPRGFSLAPSAGSGALGALRGGHSVESKVELENTTSSVVTSAGVIGGFMVVAALLSVRRQATVASATLRQASRATEVGAFCGETPVAAKAPAPASKTAAHYSTATIFPSLAWTKTGIKAGDLSPKQLKAVAIKGVDCLVGKTEGGKVFVVQNNCPHIGTPLSTGADVIGNAIICPLHGSAFDVFSGEVIEWSTQPPIIGPITGWLVDAAPIVVFQTREDFFSKQIEVLVDQNARKAYEAPYWKGLLDAQGKNDGSYY